jgi:predicted AAA+ superfamily ATPase
VCAGGSGKTTLAKQLFTRLARSFSHFAFLELKADGNSESTAQHLPAALEAMGVESANVTAVPALRQMLLDSVREKKVLYVLDNVWSANQLDALLPSFSNNGSIVIITSRLKALTDSSAWRQVHRTRCERGGAAMHNVHV